MEKEIDIDSIEYTEEEYNEPYSEGMLDQKNLEFVKEAMRKTKIASTEAKGSATLIPKVTLISPKVEEPLPGKEKLHKQPLNYLKTISKTVGKTTKEPNLFTMPEVFMRSGSINGNDIKRNDLIERDVITKDTAILGLIILQKIKEAGNEYLIINNLNEYSDFLNVNNNRLKKYLLYLGGYVYPNTDVNDEGELTLTVEQMFKVEFKYSSKVAEKYKDKEYVTIGGGLNDFIFGEPVDRIRITPNERYMKGIEGEGLGYVFIVNKLLQITLGLSDIAFKILSYTASNKPHKTIKEESLIKDLGLDKQIKAQGKPRVRETILKGFEELKELNHIKSYKYDKEKNMYSYTYSDTFIKHREFLPNKL